MLQKIIVAPDSFKGSATSAELCGWISDKLKSLIPGCEVHKLPIADGGEGTVDCFITAISGKPGARAKKIILPVCGRRQGETIDASFAVIDSEDGCACRAVVETASCAGMAEGYNPLDTTTLGVGQQIKRAVELGCGEIIVGLGGSCTNDGGAGLAVALGVRFFNRAGREFVPVGGSLCEIANLDITEARELLRGVKLTAMCDVDNPTVGSRGAAYVFAPQKGALCGELPLLDAGLRNYCEVIRRRLGVDVSGLPGGGAAGVPVIALVGGVELDGAELESVYSEGVSAVVPINRRAEPFEVSRLRVRENVSQTVGDIVRVMKLFKFE